MVAHTRSSFGHLFHIFCHIFVVIAELDLFKANAKIQRDADFVFRLIHSPQVLFLQHYSTIDRLVFSRCDKTKQLKQHIVIVGLTTGGVNYVVEYILVGINLKYYYCDRKLS